MKESELAVKRGGWRMAVFCAVLLFAGSYFVSGAHGFRAVLILTAISAPFYILFGLLDFSQAEKIVFSIFISQAFFSFFSYWIMQALHSYRLSLAATYLLLIASYPVLRKFKAKHFPEQMQNL